MPKQMDAETAEAVGKFSDFVKNDITVGKFLNVGLTFGEILNYHKGENDIDNIGRVQYNAFHRFLNNANNGSKIFRSDVRETVDSLGGKKLIRNNDLTIYFSKGSSSAARVLFEMADSGMDFYPLKLINMFDKHESLSRERIAELVSQKHGYEKSNVYSNMNTWMPKLRKTNLIIEKTIEKKPTYSISDRAAPYFSPEVREAWEELKIWPYKIEIL